MDVRTDRDRYLIDSTISDAQVFEIDPRNKQNDRSAVRLAEISGEPVYRFQRLQK